MTERTLTTSRTRTVIVDGALTTCVHQVNSSLQALRAGVVENERSNLLALLLVTHEEASCFVRMLEPEIEAGSLRRDHEIAQEAMSWLLEDLEDAQEAIFEVVEEDVEPLVWTSRAKAAAEAQLKRIILWLQAMMYIRDPTSSTKHRLVALALLRDGKRPDRLTEEELEIWCELAEKKLKEGLMLPSNRKYMEMSTEVQHAIGLRHKEARKPGYKSAEDLPPAVLKRRQELLRSRNRKAAYLTVEEARETAEGTMREEMEREHTLGLHPDVLDKLRHGWKEPEERKKPTPAKPEPVDVPGARCARRDMLHKHRQAQLRRRRGR